MYLFSKFLSPLVATFGLCLIVGCASVTPTASVDEPTADEPTAAEAVEVDVPVAAEASQSATEATAPSAEVSAATQNEPAAVFAENGIAIRGADAVAYFTEASYVAGSSNYTYEWGGATWQFSSAENRDLFATNPEQYAPQYGGFCAWAVSQGYTAAVDPTAWAIVDGKLYLNFDARIQNRWQQDIPGNIAKANQNWPGVLSN